MNRVEMALASFRKPYSCAQTVYAAFAPVDSAAMSMMKQNSAGKAPEGMCGALFAAMYVNPDKASEIKKYFEEKIGETKCTVIKCTYKVPCEECVRAASEALVKV